MFMSFFRDVIRPTFLFVIFIFILGMVMDAVASTTLTVEERLVLLEETINSNKDLRKVYHGGDPVYHFETNLETKIIQRLDKYPDGYIHIEKGQARKILTASKGADLKVQSKKIKESRISKLKERIQTLSSQTNAISKAQLEQALRLLERLEAASSTNYIDKVFKPQ